MTEHRWGHHDEQRTTMGPEGTSAPDEKNKTGHESRNGLPTDLVLGKQDLLFLIQIVDTVVKPLLRALAAPKQLIRNPFADSVEDQTPEDLEYREYLRSRRDEI